MTRRFGTQKPHPHNETLVSTHPDPSQGDPRHGIPHYPDPLPGEHDYPAHDPVDPVELDIAPRKAYYAGGKAHGVAMPQPHQHEQSHRDFYRTEDEAFEHAGPWKGHPLPVHIVSNDDTLIRASFRQVSVSQGSDPIVLCPRNPDRDTVYLLNESAGAVRLKNGPDSEIGALLPASQSRYFLVKTQDAIYAQCDPAATGEQLISIIETYTVRM